MKSNRRHHKATRAGGIEDASNPGRGRTMGISLDMASAMGVDKGSVIVLYPHEGGMSYEILPPLSPGMKASVLETYEQFKEAFAEMKRLGD